jgi:hypothetical protein
MSEKKHYEVGVQSPDDWETIHELLMADGTLEDNIPKRPVELADIKDHSPTRTTYLLTDEEAELLRAHPKVKFVNLDPQFHPEQFYVPEDELKLSVPTKQRFGRSVRNYQNWTVGSNIPSSPTATELNRTGYQLLRCTAKRNPWLSPNTETTVINNDIEYRGDGSDVDVICCDNGTWIGHVEFINRNVTNGENPPNYRGGNKLPGGGYCDVLDVVLDGPYYIDPAWFDAEPETRLETRWDGTRVPTETAARSWWGNSSQRSPQFASIGTVFITTSYTRDICHGSATTLPSSGDHGTQCASLLYGRTHGWAFNANKWHINTYGTGAVGVEQTYDICKLFHLHKPVNPRYGTKDPTITSNSYGYRAVPISSGWAFYRGTGFQYTSDSTKPLFMRFIGDVGDLSRLKGEFYDNSLTQSGDEMIAAGVIFVVAAGNSTQKQVSADHPDFNNYFAPNSIDTISSYVISYGGGINVLPTINRRGFPQHIGKTAEYVYPAINVGALDDNFGSGLERKVNYSDMGEQIDCYAPADGTIAASRQTGSLLRFDESYPNSTLISRDTRFSGTSAACPVAAGLIATVVQYNRDWTYQDIRNWLQTLDLQSSADFFSGIEAEGANATEWNDLTNTQGSDPRIIYQADFSVGTKPLPAIKISGVELRGLTLKSRST